MMPTLLILAALVLALIHLYQSAGRSFLGWAVVCLSIAAAWGWLESVL